MSRSSLPQRLEGLVRSIRDEIATGTGDGDGGPGGPSYRRRAGRRSAPARILDLLQDAEIDLAQAKALVVEKDSDDEREKQVADREYVMARISVGRLARERLVLAMMKIQAALEVGEKSEFISDELEFEVDGRGENFGAGRVGGGRLG